jgi:beta-N-acetylhexosaminidase
MEPDAPLSKQSTHNLNENTPSHTSFHNHTNTQQNKKNTPVHQKKTDDLNQPKYPNANTPLELQDKKRNPQKVAVFIVLACIIIVQSLSRGSMQFTGNRGWNYILYGNDTDTTNDATLVALTHPSSSSKTSSKTSKKMTPQQYIDLITSKMSLDQKIGQMMMVQFVGANYPEGLDTMITQYHVGSVLLFTANGNIINKTQLKNLTQQIQARSTLPMGIATDQEGGAVDRLKALDGPEPAEATIGQTNNASLARASGVQVANELASYGININLAPVVDVDNDPGSELHMDLRTYGTNAVTVSKMAGAYLQGLQHSGKVVGTLKHFPGLGDVTQDPHLGLPTLKRSKGEIENIDWAPYRTLIKSGQVHTIMVTHVIVPAIDPTTPASLSSKVVTGIIRDDLHFQGVIMTDSLTMDSISQYYTPGQAAAAAVIAGSDIIMGASSPTDVATMVNGIKQAMTDNTITQTRIDQSVERILTMKYQLGLLSIPTK